jgi:hypothetical protein
VTTSEGPHPGARDLVPRAGRSPRPAPRGIAGAALPVGILAAGALGALAVQAVFDPFTQDVPLCPLHAITGGYCPGCGATRAVHALLAGDPGLALRNNAVLVLALPVLCALWLDWIRARVTGTDRRLVPPTRVLGVCAVLVLLYGVARNLSWFWFLAPTSAIGA